ncbi:MAG TPA: hypothetical protein DCE13_08005 [Cryomorphaceae bacterium]|jgi:hypothetical protein|nr:MAG: hypothetical protein ABR98_06485 [Cryomorphaceae bacterium BACL7 MAG-120910-bin2]KRO69223.1 MAG: hypothetical protein ABR88_04205 [Cryomorphaceae bacterium BACL7 MAG-120322-bin74]KRO82006.1 MAG: hypothetical protein ABR87_07680 [Cryomorphaceae bacterium BACL7 MAG-121220-bin83]HAB32473.1 hypothetical protein [Cryomorphaceae bacterium]
MSTLRYALEQHIFHLLFQEDSLDVPGFGRLEATRFGAEIQLQSGLFLPPARRLSFSPVAGKSEVLVNHLTRFEGLTASDARAAIATSVSTWNRELLEGKRLRLDGIGSFSKTGLQWVFQASIESNFLPEAYGLPIFRVTPLAQRQGDAPAAQSGRVLPMVRSRKEQWLAPLRSAAVIAGAISLMALGTTKSDFREFVQNASIQPNWENWTENVQSWWADDASADEIVPDLFTSVVAPEMPLITEASEEDVAPEVISPATAPVAPVKKASEGTSTAHGYSLVVGAFQDIENAHRLVGQLQKAGYPAKVIDAKVGLTKVALRTFTKRDAAQAAKEEAKKAFPAVWIYSE